MRFAGANHTGALGRARDDERAKNAERAATRGTTSAASDAFAAGRARRARYDERADRARLRSISRCVLEMPFAREERRARRFARDDEVSTFCANFAPTSAASDADDADRASTSAPGPPCARRGTHVIHPYGSHGKYPLKSVSQAS